MNNSMSIYDQIIVEIRAGNLDKLRVACYYHKLKGSRRRRRRASIDKDIDSALYVAVEVGSVGACRLLWNELRPRGRRIYFEAKQNGYGLLHGAAEMGHLEVVRLFIQEFKVNVNQKNYFDQTPLSCSVDHLETARFLLENGANVNQGGKYGPLWNAVSANNTAIVHLLLVEYHANPNLNQGPEDDNSQPQCCRNTDKATFNGNSEILRILLQHGAFVGQFIHPRYGTSLNTLLCNQEKFRETKVAICRILIAHASEDHATAKFLQDTFEFTMKPQTDNPWTVNIADCQRILLDSGIDTRESMYSAIQAKNLSTCQLLVCEYRVDPFLQQEDENEDSDDDETAVSPFLAAARLPDTTFFEYFLSLWDERFSSTGGKNGDGDYPIHVVCCDPLVSLQAIKVLVNRHPDALTMLDGEQELLPFHFAANWGASMDVIFYLLQHRPEVLFHVGNAAVPGRLSEDSKQDAPSRCTSVCEGPVKKKART